MTCQTWALTNAREPIVGGRGFASGRNASALLDLVGFFCLDGLVLVGDGARFRILQAFLEALDALREIAHEIRDLALAAEQNRDQHDNDKPVPNAKTAHSLLP